MSGVMVTRSAPAKVNLVLRVLAREESGYHSLESLFVALEMRDRVTVGHAPGGVDLTVESRWPLGPTHENLARRAAEAFLEAAGTDRGVRIRLAKGVPPGGGLGGGSSDAASTLLALNRLAGEPLSPVELARIGGRLGADVPFFLSSTTLALGWGRGDRLLSLPPLPPHPVLVGLPEVSVSTARAYAALAAAREEAGGPAPETRVLGADVLASWESVAALARNDFHEPVFAEHPRLGELLRALEETGPMVALMAGSGSSVFGVYQEEAQAAGARPGLREAFPEVDWQLTRTLERWPSLEESCADT